jgi:hypothetical protein
MYKSALPGSRETTDGMLADSQDPLRQFYSRGFFPKTVILSNLFLF